jgi:thiamine-phosphate diphosphorylase
VRPLPRLFVFSDAAVRTHPHLGALAEAVASVGPAVALVAHDPTATGGDLTTFAATLMLHTRSNEASLFVAGRPDIGAALGAQGLYLARDDLSPRDARAIMSHAWIGAAVHSAVEGTTAVEEGADFLVAGNIHATPSDPGGQGMGLGLIETLASLGCPVIAIGGITPANVWDVKRAGAWGAAAFSALWNAPRPAQAALEMLEPWL